MTANVTRIANMGQLEQNVLPKTSDWHCIVALAQEASTTD
jgi:hypothetical protein